MSAKPATSNQERWVLSQHGRNERRRRKATFGRHVVRPSVLFSPYASETQYDVVVGLWILSRTIGLKGGAA